METHTLKALVLVTLAVGESLLRLVPLADFLNVPDRDLAIGIPLGRVGVGRRDLMGGEHVS